jgi:hypothetical protein
MTRQLFLTHDIEIFRDDLSSLVWRFPDRARKYTRVKYCVSRLRLTLRQGNSPHPTLQTTWNAHGAENFTLDTVELSTTRR